MNGNPQGEHWQNASSPCDRHGLGDARLPAAGHPHGRLPLLLHRWAPLVSLPSRWSTRGGSGPSTSTATSKCGRCWGMKTCFDKYNFLKLLITFGPHVSMIFLHWRKCLFQTHYVGIHGILLLMSQLVSAFIHSFGLFLAFPPQSAVLR